MADDRIPSVTIRVALEQMRQEIMLAMAPGTFREAVRAAVDRSLSEFDFQGVVAEAVQRETTALIHSVVQDTVWRSSQARDYLIDMAKAEVERQIASRVGGG